MHGELSENQHIIAQYEAEFSLNNETDQRDVS